MRQSKPNIAGKMTRFSIMEGDEDDDGQGFSIDPVDRQSHYSAVSFSEFVIPDEGPAGRTFNEKASWALSSHRGSYQSYSIDAKK